MSFPSIHCVTGCTLAASGHIQYLQLLCFHLNYYYIYIRTLLDTIYLINYIHYFVTLLKGLDYVTRSQDTFFFFENKDYLYDVS